MKWTLRLILIALALLAMTIYAAGGGHGSYLPAIAFFPLGLLSVLWSASFSSPALWLALIQYPAYGLLLDANAGKRFQLVALLLIVAHVLLAGAIFLNWPDSRY